MSFGPWAISDDPRATRGIHDRKGEEGIGWPPGPDDHDQCGEFPCDECSGEQEDDPTGEFD